MNTAVSILILIAAFTWLLMLIVGGCFGMRQWITSFDQGLEHEERARANFQRRHRFRP